MSEEQELFTLPDGTKVACGNLVPDAPSNLYSEFPQNKLLDDADIKKLLGSGRHVALRKEFLRWMINQSSVGKCNASAQVGAQYRVRKKAGMKHVALADNHMYWSINGGRDSGSLLHKGMEFAQKVGVAPRVLKSGTIGHLVYNKSQVKPELVREANEEAGRFKTHEPFRVPTDWDGFRRTIATALALDLPVIMAWHVSNSSMRLSNGYAVQGRGAGNHASFFHSAKYVGGNDIVHPDLCNSWGPSQEELYGPKGSGWGDSGFGLMTMESAFQCRRFHEFFVIPQVAEDSKNAPK